MKLKFLDTNALGYDLDFNRFSDFGDLESYGYTLPEEIVERGKDAKILISNKMQYTREILQELPELKLICLTSTGTNTVDHEACKDLGIQVRNVSGYSTESVVQMTFALALSLMMPMKKYDDYTKNGGYVGDINLEHFHWTWHEIKGKTWGIVGMGNIGRRVAMVAEAFGARIVHYPSSGQLNPNSEYEQVGFEKLLETADIISIHAPLTDMTSKLFDERAFRLMKKNAILLNLGRGAIVNEVDLINALNAHEIDKAGLDVLSIEPMSEDDPAFGLEEKERLLITPHAAWASIEARQLLMDEVYKNIEAFLQDKDRNRVI